MGFKSLISLYKIMKNQQMLTLEQVESIVYRNIENLKDVVGYSSPYLTKENERDVYKTPLLVKIGDPIIERIIDMVGIVEITIDAYSGEVLKKYTQEEIEKSIKDLLSRKA